MRTIRAPSSPSPPRRTPPSRRACAHSRRNTRRGETYGCWKAGTTSLRSPPPSRRACVFWLHRAPTHPVPFELMIRLRLLLVLSARGLAGCSAGGTTGGTASGTSASASSTPGASATPRIVGSMRTVMTQLGLNMHADSARSAAVVGVLGQGAQVAVLDYRATDGGWFKVQGQTVTGWIVADATLTAAGTFTSYASNGRGFSVLYPDSWTFAEEPNDTLFRPQAQGAQTIVVRTA